MLLAKKMERTEKVRKENQRNRFFDKIERTGGQLSFPLSLTNIEL